MRYLGVGLLIGLLGGWALRALRGRRSSQTEAWTAPAAPPPHEVAAASVAPSGPVEIVPPHEADPQDRERESRLEDETKYERLRDEEERERAEAAARLQSDPLV